MASRQRNGGMLWRTGAWSGVVLLTALDGSLLMMSPTALGRHGPPDARATRRAAAHPSHGPASRTARQDGVRPITDLIVPR
jgi:hypothetical protein